MKNLKYLVLSTFVFLLLSVSAKAEIVELYAIGQQFTIMGGGMDTLEEGPPQAILYEIDPATGTPTMIGETGFQLCLGLDFHPTTNRAYAVCNRVMERNGGGFEEGPIDEVMLGTRMEDVGQVLVMLDLDTGQGTEIGALGIQLTDAGVTDVSFRSDGVLFGVVGFQTEIPRDGPDLDLSMLEFEETTLVRINTTTGQASEVGPTGTGLSIDSIGFSRSNSLYHATDNNLDPGDLNMLDDATGNGTNLDDLDYPLGFDKEGVFNVVSSMDLASSTNQLFAFLLVQNSGDRVEEPEEIGPEARVELADGSFLGILDPDTGAIELIGMTSEFGNNFLALAALNRDELRNVPTLSEYGLIATSIFLLIAAVVYLRRKHQVMEGK